ncbi:hypothetical protein KUCAC02_001879, partial [Chaenocephalus aceratus]
ILLRRRRDGGRQRHIEADAEKCERVSVRLVMTRSWLRRAGEAAALALTHLIPTGPPEALALSSTDQEKTMHHPDLLLGRNHGQ